MPESREDPFVLRLDGVDWAFWKSCDVTVEMDAVCGAFNIQSADPQGGGYKGGATALPVSAGMECEVLIGDSLVLTGYIDKVSPSLSATDHGIAISGRSRAADMVDCSAVHKPGHWLNQNALQLATILAAPFGLSVQSVGDVGAPFPSFKLEQGETAYEALDRILKQRELLACSWSDGGIVLLKAGALQNPGTLEQGVNILSASASYDMTDRYSDYLVQGQEPGSDDAWGKSVAQVHAEAKDDAVTRYRPLIVRAESRVDAAGAKQRAAWECSVRAARAVTVTVTVQGFRDAPGGAIWQENSMTGVKIPYLGIAQSLVTSRVTYRRDAQGGSTTVMELKDPKAFQPEPKKASGAAGQARALNVEKEVDLQQRQAQQARSEQQAIKKGAK
ncbi:MAG: phage tail protein [Desulfovibrio sp.]|jgi:prophage tail gpP-like protein|nr:phage tail protein [Desulfovibrio sp.]